MAQTLLVADIGGTNARFQLWRDGRAAGVGGGVELVWRHTFRPSDFPSLVDLLRAVIVDAGEAPTRAVLAVCGPTWDGG